MAVSTSDVYELSVFTFDAVFSIVFKARCVLSVNTCSTSYYIPPPFIAVRIY